jgi:hypothetical protein
MAENILGLSIDPRSIGIAKTKTLRASGMTLVTGSGGVQGGIDSIAVTPTNAAPLAIAVALISLVNSLAEDGLLIRIAPSCKWIESNDVPYIIVPCPELERLWSDRVVNVRKILED